VNLLAVSRGRCCRNRVSRLKHRDPSLSPELAKVRDALNKYQAPVLAVHDGYFSTLGCVQFPAAAGPGQVPSYRGGGMGVHFFSVTLISPELDPLRPPVLLYEPRGDKLALVAAEWFVPLATGINRRSSEGLSKGPMEGHHRLMPATMNHYDLHGWLWKDNPSGMFSSRVNALRVAHAEIRSTVGFVVDKRQCHAGSRSRAKFSGKAVAAFSCLRQPSTLHIS
jgi:hypothetical protein